MEKMRKFLIMSNLNYLFLLFLLLVIIKDYKYFGLLGTYLIISLQYIIPFNIANILYYKYLKKININCYLTSILIIVLSLFYLLYNFSLILVLLFTLILFVTNQFIFKKLL